MLSSQVLEQTMSLLIPKREGNTCNRLKLQPTSNRSAMEGEGRDSDRRQPSGNLRTRIFQLARGQERCFYFGAKQRDDCEPVEESGELTSGKTLWAVGLLLWR